MNSSNTQEEKTSWEKTHFQQLTEIKRLLGEVKHLKKMIIDFKNPNQNQKVIQQMQIALDAKEEEMVSLKAKIPSEEEIMKNEELIKNLQSEIHLKEEEIKSLKNQPPAHVNQNEFNINSYHRGKREAELIYQRAISRKEQENRQLKRQIESIVHERTSALNSTIKKKEEEILQLKEQIQSIDIESIVHERTLTLQSAIRKKEQEILQLKEQIQSIDIESIVNERTYVLQQVIMQKEQEVNELKNQIQSINIELIINERTSSLRQIMLKKDEEIKLLKDQIQSINIESIVQERTAGFQQQLLKKENEINLIRNQIELIVNDRTLKLQQAVSKKEQENYQLRKVQSNHIESLVSERTLRLSEIISQREKEIEQLKNQIQSINIELIVNERTAGLKETITKKDKEISNLIDKFNFQENLNNELHQEKEELKEKFRNLLFEKDNQLKNVKHQMMQNNIQAKSDQQRLYDLENDFKELKETNIKCIEELSKYKAFVTEQRITQVYKENIELKKHLKILEYRRIQKIKEDCKTTKVKRHSGHAQLVGQSQQEIKSKEACIRSLNAELSGAYKKIKDLENNQNDCLQQNIRQY